MQAGEPDRACASQLASLTLRKVQRQGLSGPAIRAACSLLTGDLGEVEQIATCPAVMVLCIFVILGQLVMPAWGCLGAKKSK